MFEDLAPEDQRGDREEWSPRITVPMGAIDSHVHIFGPRERFPIIEDSWLDPPEMTAEKYRQMRDRLGLDRVVVVQPTAYGFDNACIREAVRELAQSPDYADPDFARGIAIVDAKIADWEMEQLTEAGFVGARFDMMPERETHAWEDLDRIAGRVADHDWIVDLQMDGHDLIEIEQRVREWPGWVVLDHLGRFGKPIDLNSRSFRALTRLIDRDKVWVKLSAPYHGSRTGAPDYDDVTEIARALVKWAPERMVWGSNWPHPEMIEEPPEDGELLDQLHPWCDSDSDRERILVSNPELLFKFGKM